MATSPVPSNRSQLEVDDQFDPTFGLTKVLYAGAEALASLKLTVTLLAAGIFIVFVGTLAQVDKDMWDVMADYFDSWVAMVPFQVFFPRSWFPQYQSVPGVFPFLGGKAIGCAMMFNLIAAHSVRFQSRARGKQLAIGLGILAIGVLLTVAVIVSGHNRGGLQGKPPFEWTTLWSLLKFMLVLAAAGCVWGLSVLEAARRSERILCWCALALLSFTVAVLFWPGTDLYLGDAGMRILWQLMQGTFAGCVLLVGCYFLFGKRAGVVLLHSGVGLLMIGQLLVSLFAVEERMTIREGESVNYVQDIRGVELAIVDPSGDDEDQVVAVPLTEKGKVTSFPDNKIDASKSGLPFDLEVVAFYKNSSELRTVKSGDKNLATAGIGLTYAVDEARPSSGASSEGRVDIAAAYVRFLEKDSQKDLGTHLFSQVLSEQHHAEKIKAGDKTYLATLRFKRQYKPYLVTLKDVRKDDYPGTSIPKNYSSDVQLTDQGRDFDDEIRIRMNEPLRYAGETFYQSGYRMDQDGTEITDLQVVTNTGWMIPYVACALVGVAMCAHFIQILIRFLNRLSAAAGGGRRADVIATVDEGPSAAGHKPRGRGKAEPEREKATSSDPSGWIIAAVVPAVVLLLCLMLFGYLARPPKLARDGFDLYGFGQLPVLEKGRVKPLDTLARNTMRAISNRETFKDEDGKTQPAVRWLLDLITDREKPGSTSSDPHASASVADDYAVFRIENEDVLHLLGLERRSGFRYSVNELRPKIGDFEQQVEKARQRGKSEAESLSSYERKLVELDQRIRAFTLVKFAFSPVELPPMPTEEEFKRDPERAKALQDAIRRRMMSIPDRDRELASMQPPRAVPMPRAEGEDQEQWLPYASAANRQALEQLMTRKEPSDGPVQSLGQIFAAYRAGKPAEFNAAVNAYRVQLRRTRPGLYQETKVGLEAWLNNFAPFFWSTWLYVLGFVITAVAWLVWILGFHRPVNRAAFWLTVATLCIHTLALALRVYISGRPPVTNLYSSAIFIGWACALFGVVIEAIFKLGIGNAIASTAGFSTLLIADKLAMDGDTMAVMQAVLDTQFWLSTHVVCITLGYAATFVAGLLGIVYILSHVIGYFVEFASQGRIAPFLTRRVVDTFPSTAAGSPSASPLAASPAMREMSVGKALATMIYGVMCFAILFSFIGTVLGGLWADDSWGRFWGWDPKENGALIIVLWNALVLHARWDRMVADRGLAMLAVVGNVVTAWSWFGVNELGVGLHSYGFTEGVLLYLSLFVLSQFALIGFGLIPWAFLMGAPPAKTTEA